MKNHIPGSADAVKCIQNKNGCHGNAGCLAMGPQNLHFMAAYFKNAKVYKLQIGHMYSAGCPGIKLLSIKCFKNTLN